MTHPRGAGSFLAGDATGSYGLLQPVLGDGRPVQALGRALSAAVLQSRRSDHDQPPGYDHTLRAGC